MTKQIRHKRISRKGKSFFAGKRIPDRYFLAREVGKKQANWQVKKPGDKDLTYFQLVEFRKYASSPFGDGDKDGIVNLFDKQPLNARVRKTVPPAVKKGNTKLTDVIGIFNLPRFYTCPGKTPLCSKYCYADPPEYFRPGVVFSRNKNFAWTLRKDFVSVMSRLINNIKVPWFRIHESGDFYNQKYLDKWLIIARNNPQTRFLAYTKNYKLNTLNLPRNMTIRYSVDVSSNQIREDLPICYVGVNQPTNFFLCRGKCEPGYCMACWEKNLDVYIPIHSISKERVDNLFYKQFSPEIPPKLTGRVLPELNKIGSHIVPRKHLVANIKPKVLVETPIIARKQDLTKRRVEA